MRASLASCSIVKGLIKVSESEIRAQEKKDKILKGAQETRLRGSHCFSPQLVEVPI